MTKFWLVYALRCLALVNLISNLALNVHVLIHVIQDFFLFVRDLVLEEGDDIQGNWDTEHKHEN